jgi:hypothetical protein
VVRGTSITQFAVNAVITEAKLLLRKKRRFNHAVPPVIKNEKSPGEESLGYFFAKRFNSSILSK